MTVTLSDGDVRKPEAREGAPSQDRHTLAPTVFEAPARPSKVRGMAAHVLRILILPLVKENHR